MALAAIQCPYGFSMLQAISLCQHSTFGGSLLTPTICGSDMRIAPGQIPTQGEIRYRVAITPLYKSKGANEIAH
jgi:hypothetical protein